MKDHMCITGCRAKNCRSFSGFSDRLPYVKNAKFLTYRSIKKHLYQTKEINNILEATESSKISTKSLPSYCGHEKLT